MVPSVSNRAAPCRPPVLANTFCALRNWRGMAVRVAAATTLGSSPGECLLTVRTASMEPFPHTPHDEVV